MKLAFTAVIILFLSVSISQAQDAPGENTTDLALWLKVDNGVTETSNSVSAWADSKSGSPMSADQGTGANQPTLTGAVINGYNSLSFDGNDWLDLGDTLDYTPQTDEWSFFAVYNVNTNNTGTLLGRASNADAGLRQYQYGLFNNNFFSISGGGLESGSNTATGSWNISSSVTGQTRVDMWLGGQSDLTSGTVNTNTETTNLLVGARTGGTAFQLTGSITELIMFNDSLTARERRDVESYLAIKYGISLSLPYTRVADTIYNVTSYNNDIAGIWQDDDQGLNQTTSGSISGDIVQVSNPTDLANDEYLIWGNDGGSNSTQTTNIPAGAANRVTKIWTVEEGGDVGTIDLSFNLTTLGLPSAGPTYNLLVSSTADMSSATVVTGASVSNDTVTFTTTIADGEFFTLARATGDAPGDLSDNLQWWLDANDNVTVSGSSVTTWADQSANGFDASQGTTNFQPEYKSNVINGHASVEFDGDDVLTAGDNLDYTTDFSIFTVFKTTDQGTIVSRANDNNAANRQWQLFSNNGVFNAIAGGNTRSGGTTIVDEQWRISTSVFGATDNDLYLNGTAESGSATVGASTETTILRVGNRGGTGFPYQGDIAEIIAVDTAASDSIRRNIETYLALKYAITLALPYTLIGDTIFNHTSYGNDVAGLVLDDSQDLNQASSTSISGKIITMNTASGLDDGEAIVWGNDGGATTFTTSDVPVGTTNRLERIWRLEETGDVGTVSIVFNLTTLGIDTSNSSYSLIISPNTATMPTDLSTASTNNSGVLSTSNGNVLLTFNSINFGDGEFFTLAGNLARTAPGNISTGLSLWLKADAGINLSGSQVTGWADQSGNSNSAIQSLSSDQPTYEENALNNNPALNFDGTNIMNGAGGFYSDEFFVVFQPNELFNNNNPAGRIIGFEPNDFGSISMGPSTGLQDNEIITYATGTASGYRAMQVNTSLNLSEPAIINARHNAQVSPTGQEVYYNGADTVNTTLNAGNFTELSDQPYQIGESFNTQTSALFDGRIGELISYNSTLSDQDRRDIETYLAIKWGITLDISTESYTVGGSNIFNYTSYANHIAGIGQNETTQGLTQDSSQSSNNGVMVTISSPSEMQDGEYLVWGNDGGANTFTTSNVPAGATERLNKIWRIAETGDIGTVTIAFDLSLLNLDLNNTTLNMVQAPDTTTIPTYLGNVSLVTGGIISQVNGKDILTFAGVDFSNGEYFTLAGDVEAKAPGGVSSGLEIWLTADEGVAVSSGSVSQWSDISGNGNDLMQGNSSQQPTLASNSLNGHDAIDFTSQYLDGTSGFYTHDYFVVLSADNSITSASGDEYILAFSNNDSTGLVLGAATSQTDEVITHVITDASSNVYASGELNNSLTYTGALIFNARSNSGATDQEIYGNGVLLSTTTVGTFNELSDQAFRLGDDFGTNGDFEGQIAEVISYSARLSDSDRRDVETYLALKYGLTLDITTQDYTAGGATLYDQTSYADDIAGIGQDLSNGLQQYSSRSSNSGSVVTISNPSSLGDGDYIIWGNDGASKSTVQSTEIPAAYDDRLAVEWAAETTGTPGTISVSVYIGGITDYNRRGQSPELYTLLLNSSSDFSTITDSITASSLSGDTLVFNSVSFTPADTTYFTVAVPPVASPSGSPSLWLKADAGITLSGNDVSTWSDLSGNGNDASGGVSPSFSSDQINGNPSISFDGTEYLSLGDILNYLPGTDSWSFFSVFNASADGTILSRAANTTFSLRQYQYYVNSNVYTQIIGGNVQGTSSNVGSTWTMSSSLTNSTNSNAWIDGTQEVTNSGNGSANETAAVLIGARSGGTGFLLTGDIAEIVMYASELSSTDRVDVETYLSLKYGITRPLPYTVGGSNIYNLTSYNNDIAGLASNADQALSVTTSSSNNSDAIVSMSGPSSLSDGEYLIWGNDDAVTTEVAETVTGTAITHRMTRKWGITETGNPGTVSVSMDLSGLGYSTETQDSLVLIVDTNADFTDGILAIYGADSYSSNIVTFNGVDFTTATNFGLGTGSSNITADDDNDGIPNYFETAYGTDYQDGDSPASGGAPLTDDADSIGIIGDLITDALELILVNNGATAPITRITDTDGDGISDHIEVSNGSSPYSADAPTTSGGDDSDSDGLPNGLEALIIAEGGAADPDIGSDNDSDGVPDYFEVINGSDPGDVNDPVTAGGTLQNGISIAMDSILELGGATSPVTTSTDTDNDGIPDYIEAQTYTDPFDSLSPSVAGTPALRAIQADYVASGANCTNISGYQWIHVTDNLGNLVYSVNPIGNDLGNTCFGVRVLTSEGSVRDNGNHWVLNRNWFINPTTQPGSLVYLRLYSLTQENIDLRDKLITDGETPGSQDNFDADSIKITKVNGLDALDPLLEGGVRTIHDPFVSDYSTNGKAYTIPITSFSGFAGHFNPNNPDDPLPVEMLEFYSTANDGYVQLHWATATELNNDHFIIQRSTDGLNFQEIGQVEGNGTTNEQMNYSFKDHAPLSGLAYYRLKQMDFDGVNSLSETIAVNYEYSVDDHSATLFPNPAQYSVSVYVSGLNDIDYTDLYIADTSGKVFPVKYTIENGSFIINTEQLANGLYLLNLTLNDKILQLRFKISR